MCPPSCQVLDVTFKGRRVAYEIGLSEAASMYSGSGDDMVFFLDSAYSMTQMGGDLQPATAPRTPLFSLLSSPCRIYASRLCAVGRRAGVDCPPGAALLGGTRWSRPEATAGGRPIMSDVSLAADYRPVCVFEAVAGGPHWRLSLIHI